MNINMGTHNQMRIWTWGSVTKYKCHVDGTSPSINVMLVVHDQVWTSKWGYMTKWKVPTCKNSNPVIQDHMWITKLGYMTKWGYQHADIWKSVSTNIELHNQIWYLHGDTDQMRISIQASTDNYTYQHGDSWQIMNIKMGIND